jgi:hypothetical protein
MFFGAAGPESHPFHKALATFALRIEAGLDRSHGQLKNARLHARFVASHGPFSLARNGLGRSTRRDPILS